MFRFSNFSIIVLITALYCLQLWHHEVQAGNFSDAAVEDKCNQKTNKSCDDCIKEGCTYCASTKECMTFDLVNDTLHNKCKGQDWKYKQCLVNGKFLLIAVPVIVSVVLLVCVCCCCRLQMCRDCCCSCCRGSIRCISCIFYYLFCCCCCCEDDSSYCVQMCQDCCCSCCHGSIRCIRCIFFYLFCCCCCCEEGSSSSVESHGLLRGVRNPMTQGAAARIQSATAKAFGGFVPKGSFASRAQSVADRRAYWNIW